MTPQNRRSESSRINETDPAGVKGADIYVTGSVDDDRVQLVVDAYHRHQITSDRLLELQAKVAYAVASSRATSTVAAYRGDLADFGTWCQQFGVTALPAEPMTVAGYVSDLAQPCDDRPPRSVSTINRRIAAISQAHQLAGFANPTRDPLVKETLKGIRRIVGVAPTRKRAVATADIRAAVTRLGTRPIDDRDRLVLLLGFASGMRRNELAGLNIGDVVEVPEGLLVHLRTSKTDQEGRGRRIEIVYGQDPTTCPVTAYRTWITKANIASGPLLRRVDRHGNIHQAAITAQAIAIVVKRHMALLGYDMKDFAGHSLRRGLATTATRNGATERTVMRTTGHTSIKTMRNYVDDAELFTDPASAYLGL